MENASKALIIAGAILIAILLISVGIMVMNSVNKPLDEVTSEADSQSAQMFNSKFANYAGSGKSTKEVYSLINTVIATTQNGSRNVGVITIVKRINGQIWMYYTAGVESSDLDTTITKSKSLTIQELKTNIFNNPTFKVSFTYDAKGYIRTITIRQEGI